MPPLPVDQPPFVSGAGPRPFRSRDDVVAQLDDILSSGSAAPVRDALIDALTALLLQLEYRGEYAIAQCDLLRASAQYLTSIGGDDHGVPRAPGEDTEAYRTRLLAPPLSVTEQAILAGVNAILAPFTATQCRLIDASLDRFFIGTGDPGASWRSFIGASPEYPDRLYSGQEALNGGFSRPNSDPGGARLYSDSLGRHFTLLLPDLRGIAQPGALSADEAPGRNPALGFYLGDTSSPDVAGFVSSSFAEPFAVYQAIESFVNATIGQSIRWGFIAELSAT